MVRQYFTKADLAQFTGSQVWYRHWLMKQFLYTEGVHFVAESAGAFWLVDEIVIAQTELAVVSEEFQIWTLAVGNTGNAELSCGDGNGKVVFTKRIPWTDFPLERIDFYLCDSVLMLSSEY